MKNTIKPNANPWTPHTTRYRTTRSISLGRCYAVVSMVIVTCNIAFSAEQSSPWRNKLNRAVLQNDTMEARFQAGMIYSLKDRVTGNDLLSISPELLPSKWMIFDETLTDLDTARVRTGATPQTVHASYFLSEGNRLSIRWLIERRTGDLILQMSALTTNPIGQFRYNIFGSDITRHSMIWVSGYGASHTLQAPWNGIQLGDPQTTGSPSAFPHPVVALFQGRKSGWFIEGRDSRIGPASLLVKGTGNTATLGMVRRFPIPKKNPDLFEIRIRTYAEHWEDAVDPYVEWLEKGCGFIPISKLPKEQSWIQDIKSQSYITVGDYEQVEALAERLDPHMTFIGRQAEHRNHAFDIAYPDYRLTTQAKKWMKRVRSLGFHVGVHYNSNGISADFPDLIERFKPGLAVVGKDEDGNDVYQAIHRGQMIRCSSAYKPWRDYLIEQMRDAVDAGVDVIYLDETMAPTGKFIVDGVNGIEGILALMKETLEAYPHVAIETEQFNLLTAKYGKLALSQMPLGHPLSAYIFQRYVKIVPEGVMYSPTSGELMDAYDCWGGMLPGANPGGEETWLQIAEAFQTYDLVPDGRLQRKQVAGFEHHYTHGQIPIDKLMASPGGIKLFGFKGHDGVTAFFEKHPTRRGLVVYEPGRNPKWFGVRHHNIRSYKGPGVPSFYGFRQYMKDWIIYNEDSLLGLDPDTTYMFDESVSRPQTRFHVTSVPDDFQGYSDMERRIAPYEIGKDDSFFRLVFAGHGSMTMHVPDEYDVYLDGEKVHVNRETQTASVSINATMPGEGNLGYFIALQPDGSPMDKPDRERPSTLLAFRRTDQELSGLWAKLPWQRAKDTSKNAGPDGDDFSMNVGAFAIFIGRLPIAESIHLQGKYQVSSTTGGPGDGVVLLNGKQVLRVPMGSPPYPITKFKADISSYAGQFVLMEVIPDKGVRAARGHWFSPRIVANQ